MSTLQVLVALVVVLGVLIFVHELGHFIAAKAVGIQVLRFSLGFGRPVLSWRRGETEYWISWIPLGGYVKMAGLEDEGPAGELEGGAAAVPVDPERSFDRKPLWARVIVIMAGVTMNAVLAYLLFAGMAVALGRQELATTQVDSVRVGDLPAGAEELRAIGRGDRIEAVNGQVVETWEGLVEHLLSQPAPLELAVTGRRDAILLNVPLDPGARRQVARALVPGFAPVVGQVNPGEAGRRGGLLAGDVVLRVNGDTVRLWSEFQQAIRRSPDRAITVDVRRDQGVVTLSLTPRPRPERVTEDSSITVGRLGIAAEPPTRYVRQSVGAALGQARDQTIMAGGLILGALRGLFTGAVSLGELGGPILIGELSAQAARLGVDRYLSLMAVLSINLAILNLLPIPVLDGGHLLFMVIETVRRRPLSQAVRLRWTQVGLVVVLGIMLIAVGNDLLRKASDWFGLFSR